MDKSTGVVCDQSILLTVPKSLGDYSDKLRRVRYYDAETNKTLVFLTNNFLLPAVTIAQLYKQRWQVEHFFKWIKRHLRIKSFFGTSENAMKAQSWITVSVYLIVAIIKKRLNRRNNPLACQWYESPGKSLHTFTGIKHLPI